MKELKIDPVIRKNPDLLKAVEDVTELLEKEIGAQASRWMMILSVLGCLLTLAANIGLTYFKSQK